VGQVLPASVRRIALADSLKSERAAAILRTFACANRYGNLAIRSQVIRSADPLPYERSAGSRAAQAAMGDQHFLAEGVMMALCDHFCRNAAKSQYRLRFFAGQDERTARLVSTISIRIGAPVRSQTASRPFGIESPRSQPQGPRRGIAGFGAYHELGGALHFLDSALRKVCTPAAGTPIPASR